VQGDYAQSDDVRDEVLMGLVYRARTDPEFKRRARRDLEGALWEYRYQLTEEELRACRQFHADTQHLTNEELDQRLAGLADPIGIRGI
jgi:hypothetical protein